MSEATGRNPRSTADFNPPPPPPAPPPPPMTAADLAMVDLASRYKAAHVAPPDVRTLAAIHAPPMPEWMEKEVAEFVCGEFPGIKSIPAVQERYASFLSHWRVNYADTLLARLNETEGKR